MKRYAFIDVHNTNGSASALGFTIDPEKLYNYLMYDKWSCSDVFWYSGRIQNEKHEKNREKIVKIGYKIRDKNTHFLKKKKNSFDITCPDCGHEHVYVHKKNRLPKANCDVELTVDCLELAEKGDEFLIFTGDGDFKYLIDRLREKGVKVRLFSTRKKDKFGDYRFSTRYKDMLNEGQGDFFMELDNLRVRLEKEPKNAETAAKRDGSER